MHIGPNLTEKIWIIDLFIGTIEIMNLHVVTASQMAKRLYHTKRFTSFD